MPTFWRRGGRDAGPLALWAPMVEEGGRGIAFVEAALSSQAKGGRSLEFQLEI